MIQTFKCPSCGARLSYEGESATITCPFCNAPVPVPAANRAGRPTSTVQIVAMVFGLALVAAAGIGALVISTNLARTGSVSAPPATSTVSAPERDATSGAIARMTAIPQSTLDAQSQEATATAQAEAAANATATADTQQLATRMAADQTGWSPFTLDAFDTNANGWPLGTDGDEYIGIDTALQEGQYVWTVNPHQGNSYWNIFPSRTKDFADFYASADLRLNSGGEGGGYAYGLVFRHMNDDYGFFGIQNDGAFRLLVVYGTSIYQHYITTSSAIRTEPGQVNHIAVRASGPDFIFLINDEVVWRLNEDFPAGEIGLGVDVLSANGEAQARFDNFEVRAP